MKTILFIIAFAMAPFALAENFNPGETKSIPIGNCIQIEGNQKLCYSGSVNDKTYAVNVISEYVVKGHNHSSIYDTETYYLPKKVNNLNFKNMKLSYFNELQINITKMW